MPEGRQVPWLGWQEWERVKSSLFSSDFFDQKAGIGQVRLTPAFSNGSFVIIGACVACFRPKVLLLLFRHRLRCAQVRLWRARSKLPLAVDVTASLVELRQT